MSDTNNGMNMQRNYKDTLFRMLFSGKENLLSLYNALNGTSYTDTDGLIITTLENAVYMNYKNDISFVLDSELMLYEHQSTVNPNMPLRSLFYVARVIQGLIREEDFYGRKQVKIPAPRFIVFYNGVDPQPERQTLRLSDAFEGTLSEGAKKPEGLSGCDLELTVTVYNINFGYNHKIMEECQVLKEYAQYVYQVRMYARKMAFPEAVEAAVDYCIRNRILADFLAKNRAEAIAMSIFEYDEEKHIRNEKELSYQEGQKTGIEIGMKRGIERGIEQGMERGMAENLIKSVESLMKNLGFSLQKACESLGTTVRDYESAKGMCKD